MKQNKYLIGLTGGIATGKSLAAHFVEMQGYKVVDLDKIAHNLLENDQNIIKELVEAFGEEICDEKKINRKKLGKIVFESREKLQKLNSIMHKRIYKIALEEVENADAGVIFMDIPLLYETMDIIKEFDLKFDEIWLITSSKARQMERLMIRDKIDESEAKKKLEAQLSLKEKERMSDIVIYNNSSIESIYEELRIEIKNLNNRVNSLIKK